ncbi:MAG: hypothetical protein NVS4B8_30260 [Herpetosiphon sp.]
MHLRFLNLRLLVGLAGMLSLIACGMPAATGGSPRVATTAAVPSTAASALPAQARPNATATMSGVSASGQRFPDILAATLTRSGAGTYELAVTIASSYDTAQRYADGWRVLGPDRQLLGEHSLTHDHATEQPFTRTQSGLMLPPTITTITIEGRDKSNGYGGKTVTIAVPQR